MTDTEPQQQPGRRATRRGKVHTTAHCLYGDQIRDLAQEAHQQDRSASECVREAVDDWLEKQRSERQ